MNGKLTGLKMTLGSAGEAYFAEVIIERPRFRSSSTDSVDNDDNHDNNKIC